MADLGMGSRCYKLTCDEIRYRVEPCKPGNYALGDYDEETNRFIVFYVGRSDDDLARRLMEHVGEKDEYKYFKFVYADNSLMAYRRECKNYHDFGRNKDLDNEIHPRKPNDMVRCSICGE